MRVVLDTNVLLAAFAACGLCEALLEICLSGHRIVLSDFILGALDNHLAKKLHLPFERVAWVRQFLREHADLVHPANVPADACRDPED